MDQKVRTSRRYVRKAEKSVSENKFGKTSRISLRTKASEGKTQLADISFTAPYKIMAPFEKKSGGISVMPLCASAGIMEGDCQEFEYYIGEGSDIEILSQSFEKIHKMKAGKATRSIKVNVEKNAVCYYYPQPVIPYAQSAFESKMEINLEDKTSKLFMLDIVSCGRSASDERFEYRLFSSKVEIRREGKLIYRDNTRYEPAKMDMEGMGMYEGYTHMANIFLSSLDEDIQEEIWNILDNEEEVDGGVTRLSQGDLAVRIFGKRAQKLQEIAEKIKETWDL